MGFIYVLTVIVYCYLPANNPGSVGNACVLNYFLQVWKLTLNSPDLVQLLLILHDENVALAVLQDILAGIGAIGGVNACGKSSRKNGCQVRNVPLGRVEAEDADRAVLLQAEVNEGLGHSPSLLVIGRPAPDRLKRNIILNLQRKI